MSPLVVQAWLMIAAAGWKSYQLLRSRIEFPVIAVTVALLTQVLGQAVPSLVGEHAMIDVFGERGYRFVTAAVLAVTLLAISLFFQSSARAGTLTRRRLHVEVVVGAVALLATLVAVTLQPAVLPGGGDDAVSSNVADFAPGRIEYLYIYFLIINVYFLWAAGSAAYYALAAARRARSYLRAGLVLAGASLAVLTISVALRLIAGAVILAGHPGGLAAVRVAGLGVFVALIGFVVGVSFPAAGTRARAVRVWLRRRRMFRQLEELARRMQGLFPELTLRVIPAYSVLERAGLRHVARNSYRRVIEIHDGLMQLSRYLDPGVVTADADPEVQARHVAAALRARDEGREPGDHAVDLGVAGTTDGLDDDGGALVALAMALRGRLGGLAPA